MNSYPNADDYAFALERPAGKRPFKGGPGRDILDKINRGKIEKKRTSRFLHVASGYYAYIYKCKTAQGMYALRCLRFAPPNDIATRYRAIAAFQQQTPFHYLVQSYFFDDALFASVGVQGAYYPVLVMSWVEGNSLLPVVRDLAADGDKQGLKNLSIRWERMIQEMKQCGVVHGDLHPDNVHVLPGTNDLRLVDYDTLTVPGFEPSQSGGAHAEGYVHPIYSRDGVFRKFSLHMDDFGALVILLSLRVLAKEPKLFGRSSQQNLLFSRSDLEDPKNSQILNNLVKHDDPKISELSKDLSEECLAPKETGSFLFYKYVSDGDKYPEYNIPTSWESKPGGNIKTLPPIITNSQPSVPPSTQLEKKTLEHGDVNPPSSAKHTGRKSLPVN